MQLRDFCRIRPLTSKTAAITLANSFIHFRLDYCNSLFYSLSNYFIHRLHKVQNTVARIVTRSVCSSYITPVLKSLHWLPVNYRINFKIVVSLIVRCLYMNLIILVLCSAFDLILILFVLPLLAHCYYHTSVKNHMVFVNFHMLHLISGITYLIIFILHQPICRLEKIWKLIFLTKLFLLRLYPYLIWLIWLLTAIPFDCSSE